MDIFSVLKAEHREVGDLLDQAMKCDADDPTFAQLAAKIESALTVHAAVEEKVFYSVLRERSEPGEDTVDVYEGYVEHDVIKHLIALLKSEKRRDEAFKAELQVLGEDVKHHVREEESTIFGLARKELDKDELEEMGAQFEREKANYLQAA